MKIDYIDIDYIDNEENKSITLPIKKIILDIYCSGQPQILSSILRKRDADSLEYKVINDLIFYLSRGNYFDKKNSKIKELILLDEEMIPKNISGETNTMGATLFLILHLKKNESMNEEVSILTRILLFMMSKKDFTQRNKRPKIVR